MILDCPLFIESGRTYPKLARIWERYALSPLVDIPLRLRTGAGAGVEGCELLGGGPPHLVADRPVT